MGSEQPIDAGGTERDAGWRRLARRGVDPSASDRAAGPLGDQTSCTVGPETGEPDLLALLEAEARLGAEAVALARPADRDRVEDRGLDNYRRRGVGDLGARPAHDPRDAERAPRVGDQEGLRVEV